jgi:hypothetical protein
MEPPSLALALQPLRERAEKTVSAVEVGVLVEALQPSPLLAVPVVIPLAILGQMA